MSSGKGEEESSEELRMVAGVLGRSQNEGELRGPKRSDVFRLNPALSLGKRGNQGQSWCEGRFRQSLLVLIKVHWDHEALRRPAKPTSLSRFTVRTLLLPLPEGEGWGEGEAATD